MKQIILLAAASAMLTIVATPVVAKDAGQSSAKVSPSDGAAKKTGTKYCVVDATTGSRLPSKVCLTREDWLKRGFDPVQN